MPRLPLADPDQLDADARAQFDRFPSNLTRTLLLLEHRLARALPETANALRASALDPAIREAIILRVASISHSAYERMQHLGQATAVGWTDADVTAIEHGEFSSLAPSELPAILSFVDQCIVGSVDDVTFDAARTALGDRGLVTAIVLVGHYMTVARLTGILEVELDEQPDPWTHEH